MKQSLLASIVLSCFLIINQSNAQDAPKASIKAPTTIDAPKQSVIIRTEGSKGDVFKFAMTPEVSSSFTLRDDSTNELIFMFVPEKEGTYSVAFTASVKTTGKVDIVILQIQVGKAAPVIPVPPTPTPSPVIDDLTKLLQGPYQTDTAAGVGTAAQKDILASVYKVAATKTVLDKSLTKPSQVYDTMRTALAQLNIPVGSLPALRGALSDYQRTALNITATTVLDDPLRQRMGDLFTKIANSLAQLD